MILTGHHVLGLPKAGVWALCLVLLLAGEDGRKGLGMGWSSGGMCTVELDICISGHFR